MANYRPKSLNELNNLYDKSIAAQNAIKNKGSAIAGVDFAENAGYSATDFEKEFAVKEKTPSQKASDELSDALNNFMKNFGEAEPEKPIVRQPLPITKAIKTTKPKTENKKELKPQTPVSRVKVNSEPIQKPTLMRNSERSELLDDYKKIMNDEDDDVAYLKNIIKKKKKIKKDKHQGSPLFTDETENEKEEESSDTLFEEKAEPEIIQEQSAQQQEEEAPIQSEEASQQLPDEQIDEPADEAEIPQTTKKRKHVFLQIVLIILLLGILLASLAITAGKIVIGVDSGNAFADKYYVFTSSETYNQAGINQGDLVITENKEIETDEVFVYTDSQNESFTFATKGTQIDEERFMAHNDSEVSLIYESYVRGAVITTVPQIGSLISVLMENFVIVVSVLVAVALIIILVLAFAFKSKPNYEIGEFEEEEDELQAEPEEEESTEEDEEEDSDNEEESKEEIFEGLFSTID